MKNKEVISRIRNDIKAIVKDDHISSRYVLSVASTKARTAMASQMHLYELLRIDSLFKTVRCVELEQVDSITCNVVELRMCKQLMRSKKKLPKLFSAKYGALIRNVMTVDGGVVFEPTTKLRLSNRKKRSYANVYKQNLFYVNDGYLYLPDSEIEIVDIEVLGFSDSEIDEMSGCKSEKSDNRCTSVLEEEFVCPEKLLDTVISLASQEIASKWRAIPTDENPNMDSNIRSQTTK